jgi:hypothetical protein
MAADVRELGARERAAIYGRWALPLLAALGVGVCLAALDVAGADFWSQHPMLAQAIGGVILFVQGGILLPEFLRFHDARRQQQVGKIAYESLAQSVNDAGRRLLSLVNGADLFALGIVVVDRQAGESVPTVLANRSRLRRAGFDTFYTETHGRWPSQASVIRDRLAPLLADPGFVRALFRDTSRVRRDLQAAEAVWAPTMFSDSGRTKDLGAFGALIRSCHELQSRLRDCSVVACVDAETDAAWLPDAAVTGRILEALLAVEDTYLALIDRLNPKGADEKAAPPLP